MLAGASRGPHPGALLIVVETLSCDIFELQGSVVGSGTSTAAASSDGAAAFLLCGGAGGGAFCASRNHRQEALRG